MYSITDQFVSLLPIGLIAFYFLGNALTIANYSGYFRFNEDVYGSEFRRAYLGFTVVGAIVYFLFCSPAWLWSAKYCTTASDRVFKLALGMGGIFLFHDLPIFILEYHAILCCGWRNEFQGFVFIVQNIEFIISFSFGWLSYTYAVAGLLQKQQSASLYGPGEQLKTGAVNLAILPSTVPSSPIHLQQPMLQADPRPVFFPPASPTGSGRVNSAVRWTGTERKGAGYSSNAAGFPQSPGSAFGSGRAPSTTSGRPVPLRERLSESQDSEDDADDAYYRSEQLRTQQQQQRQYEQQQYQPQQFDQHAEAAAQQRYDRQGSAQRYAGGYAGGGGGGGGGGSASNFSPREMEPITYTLPPLSTGMQPTPSPPVYIHRAPLGAVFVERTVL